MSGIKRGSEQPAGCQQPRAGSAAGESHSRRTILESTARGKSKELAELEREFREAIAAELSKTDSSDHARTNLQALACRWVELAKSGNLGAIEALADRIMGKPKQSTELTGDGRPVQIQIISHIPAPGDPPEPGEEE